GRSPGAAGYPPTKGGPPRPPGTEAAGEARGVGRSRSTAGGREPASTPPPGPPAATAAHRPSPPEGDTGGFGKPGSAATTTAAHRPGSREGGTGRFGEPGSAATPLRLSSSEKVPLRPGVPLCWRSARGGPFPGPIPRRRGGPPFRVIASIKKVDSAAVTVSRTFLDGRAERGGLPPPQCRTAGQPRAPPWRRS